MKFKMEKQQRKSMKQKTSSSKKIKDKLPARLTKTQDLDVNYLETKARISKIKLN